MSTKEQREAAERLIATVYRNLEKWRTWFPSEKSEVAVPREDLLAIVAIAREHFAERPTEAT